MQLTAENFASRSEPAEHLKRRGGKLRRQDHSIKVFGNWRKTPAAALTVMIANDVPAAFCAGNAADKISENDQESVADPEKVSPPPTISPLSRLSPTEQQCSIQIVIAAPLVGDGAG